MKLPERRQIASSAQSAESISYYIRVSLMSSLRFPLTFTPSGNPDA
uniref:Uncharacterized protein n=1 Tax=Anguilla anguilla TaxID=7936 RepID=A0A0E9RGP4_ANGAN